MRRIIIADTSCLILLSKINELDLLKKTYGQITTTLDIVIEFGETLPDWIVIESVIDQSIQEDLETKIDKGESSAIALALENKNSILILDDFKARKVAEKLNLTVTGTLGVMVKAKLLGIIPSVKPLLNKIKATNFRISAELETEILESANEL